MIDKIMKQILQDEIMKQILRDIKYEEVKNHFPGGTSTSVRVYEDLIAHVSLELSNSYIIVNFAVNFMEHEKWHLSNPNFIEEARQWINHKTKELADRAPKLKAEGHKWSNIKDRSHIYYNTYQKCIKCNKEIFWLDAPSDVYKGSTRHWDGNPDEASEIVNGKIIAGYGSKFDMSIISLINDNTTNGFICDECLDKMIKNKQAEITGNYWKP